MQSLFAFIVLSWCLAAVFGAVGVLHLAGPQWLRETYHRWDYAAWFSLLVGVLDVVVAALLVTPELRGLGIVLAAAIMFFAIVVLLDHEKYLVALPATVLMLALIPASLSIPPRSPAAHYSVEKPTQLSQNR